MWSLHTMDYDSALKRKAMLPPATTRTNPEDPVLSEMSQTQKDEYGLIRLLWGPWRSPIHKNWKKTAGAGAGGGGGESAFHGDRVSVWGR